MSKVTKNKRIKKLERQVKGLTVLFSSLNTWSEYADNMLTELNHALPDPEYDAKCEAQESDIDASLDRHRERLGLNKPQLKQLDQSIFDGLDEKWRFAAVDANGAVHVYDETPRLLENLFHAHKGMEQEWFGDGYDTSNWQNSLIERDTAKELLEVDLSSELTGSELCRAMLGRGDILVACKFSDYSEYKAIKQPVVTLIKEFNGTCFRNTIGSFYRYVVPISLATGEPLTAAEAGL